MPGDSTPAQDTAPPPPQQVVTSPGRATPVRIALASAASPAALRSLSAYLGDRQATEGTGFGIVRNGRGIPAAIVLHPGSKPGAASKVVEELSARHLISKSEKIAALKILTGVLLNAPSLTVAEPDPGQFSVNGHRYRLDMRESVARTTDGHYVAEVVPLGKVSPQELITDTRKVRGLLSRGLPEGSITNVKDVSEDCVFHDNGDVRAQGANQFYICSELSPDSILESLPRESPTHATSHLQRFTKAEGFSVSVGGNGQRR